MYPRYAGEIAALPADKPRFAVFVWDGFLTVNYGVAYDETDEMASDHPSESWKQQAERYGVRGHGYRRAIGHFYFVDLE
jgi:hypothetical protein